MDLETKSQGERLASIRIGRQLNQEELANICNLSRATISRLENDQIPLSKKIAHQLALALRVDITLLTKGSRKLPQKKNRRPHSFYRILGRISKYSSNRSITSTS